MHSQYVVFILKEELQKRQQSNPLYSSRAFAKFLNVDPSLLAKILSGKRAPTNKVCQNIEKKLKIKLAPVKKSAFAVSDLGPKKIHVPSEELASFFHSGWEPYAFWARLQSGTFKGDHRDMAREFGMDEERSKEIFEKLLNSGLCSLNADGTFKSENVLLSNLGLKNFENNHSNLQEILMKNAIHTLKTSKDCAHFSSITFRMSPENLNLAKNITALFRRQASALLEGVSPPEKQKVYGLQISIVPFSKN